MTTLLAGFLLACGRVPSRPPAVAPEAAWAGEGKQGLWLKVTGHQGTLWQLEVWDRQGKLLGQGNFRLRGFAKAKIVPEEVLGWELGALHLKDGTWLVPEPTAPQGAAR